MTERPPTSLRMRSAILAALIACTTIAVVLGGAALVGVESSRQAAMHRNLLDALATRIASSLDDFLALHTAALAMAAAHHDDCADADCRARALASLRLRFPAFVHVSANGEAASGDEAANATSVVLDVPLAGADRRATDGLQGTLRIPVERLFAAFPDRENPTRELLLLDAADKVLYSSSGRYVALRPAPAGLVDAVQAGADEARVGEVRMLLQGDTTTSLHWRVIVMMPRDRIAPARSALLGAAGLALFAGLAIAAVASIWISRALARALESLADAMRRLDPDHLHETSPGDRLAGSAFRETQDIAAAVRAMCERLVAAREIQRQSHADLDRANRELAALVREREAQVEARTGELERALDTANEAIRARDALLANTSHEIRTPLYGIVGGAELVRPSLSTEEDLRNLDAIMQSAESLMQLINDLLDFSRINAGALALEAKPFSLADVANDVAATMRPLAAKRGLEVRVSSRLASPVRRGDALRVRQVLLNLLGNAVKFTERGTVSMDLEDDGGDVRLVVADTGVGVAADDLDRIFKPFEQADASMRRRFQGTGLGLAIVDRLVSAMGGSIDVESQLGKGSTFTLRLSLPATVAEPAHDDASLAPAGKFEGMRVLVVDDVQLNRMLLTAQLERLGVQPTCAVDGYEALTLLARESVDLVLLDVQMPGIDGLETAERMRGLPNGRNVRIVAVTANAQPGERDNCLAASMDDYVTKPLRVATLRKILTDASYTGFGAASS